MNCQEIEHLCETEKGCMIEGSKGSVGQSRCVPALPGVVPRRSLCLKNSNALHC